MLISVWLDARPIIDLEHLGQKQVSQFVSSRTFSARIDFLAVCSQLRSLGACWFYTSSTNTTPNAICVPSSVFRDLWSVRAKYGCIVLSSLKNRSCCPSEFFFQWFYRTKGLADTEITKKQKNTLSLLIIFEWTLTIFDLSKVQSLGCPHRLIGFHTTIKNYNIAPPLGYLLTSLPTSNISLDFLYSSPALLVHLRRGSFSVTLKRLGQ